ncbi:MAG: DUF5317 domain-containing protein [Chloroflexi bacterium]|nr:DUF5317 domain-containing protein [Chloroflexota bacterium]
MVALGLQIAAEHGVLPVPRTLYPPTLAGSYALLLLGVVRNLHFWGFRVLLVGLGLNVLVLAVHGWYMPVSPEALRAAGFLQQASLESGAYLDTSKSILLSRPDTALWFLTDIIPITKPIRLVVSVGDLIVLAALVILLWEVIARQSDKAVQHRSAHTG